MQPIDLVKHQTRILPGLEEAAHRVIGRLNEARKILKLPQLILREDANEKAHYVTISKEAAEQLRQSAMRFQKRKAEADRVRGRIADRVSFAPGTVKGRVPKTLVKRRRA